MHKVTLTLDRFCSKYERRDQIDPPLKKLPSKSPALLGLSFRPVKWLSVSFFVLELIGVNYDGLFTLFICGIIIASITSVLDRLVCFVKKLLLYMASNVNGARIKKFHSSSGKGDDYIHSSTISTHSKHSGIYL